MCGIVYAHGFDGKPVNNGILNVFDAQRSRGLQGFGLFDGQKKNIVRATSEDKILKWLCKYDSNLLLFHHRYPTSTPNKKGQSHPFTTKDHFKSEYIMVHNGTISNAHSLKTAHEKLGITYRTVMPDGSFNDSEAFMWDLALYLEGKQQKLETIGALAFVVIKLTKGQLDKMYFGRNSNPLNLFRVKQGILLSSEGQGDAIDTDTLYTWNYKLKRLTTKKLSMPRWMTSDWSYPSYSERSSHSSSYSGWSQQSLVPYGRDYDYEERFEDVNWQGITITTTEAWALALKYLWQHHGNFELAYADMESAYTSLAEYAQIYAELREMKLYETAMVLLEADPEWDSLNAISSMVGMKGVA